MGEQPAVLNRTRGQWIRGTVVAWAVGTGGFAALFVTLSVVINGAGGYLGAYIGIPRIPLGGGLVAAGILGLATAFVFGFVTRPRLLASSGPGTSTDSSAAQYWPGYDPRAASSSPDPDEMSEQDD